MADPHALERHFHLVNREDLETILKAEVFVNVANNQVKAAHKILEYDPIQKSFSASKYVIKAKDPRLHRITVVEHGFLLPEGSTIPEGAPLVGPSSSHQAVEVEGGRVESVEQVAELGQSEDEFGVFDQVNLFKDPSSDLGDPSLTEVDLLSIGDFFLS